MFLLLSHTRFLFSFSLHLTRFLFPPHIYTVPFFSHSPSNNIFFSISVLHAFSFFSLSLLHAIFLLLTLTRFLSLFLPLMLSSSSLLEAFSFSLFLPLRRYIPPPHTYALSLFSLSPSYSLSFSSSLLHAFSLFFLHLTRYLSPPRSNTPSLCFSLSPSKILYSPSLLQVVSFPAFSLLYLLFLLLSFLLCFLLFPVYHSTLFPLLILNVLSFSPLSLLHAFYLLFDLTHCLFSLFLHLT